MLSDLHPMLEFVGSDERHRIVFGTGLPNVSDTTSVHRLGKEGDDVFEAM